MTKADCKTQHEDLLLCFNLFGGEEKISLHADNWPVYGLETGAAIQAELSGLYHDIRELCEEN